jgi:hypothetical protein
VLPDARLKILAWTMSKTATRLIDCSLAASFVLSLIAYAYLGTYSRYMADDYSAFTRIRTHGFLGAQINWYQAWTGRFSFTFVNSLVALLGPTTPRFVPGLLLALWFTAAVWAVYRIHSLSGKISRPRVVLFAGFIIFATLTVFYSVSFVAKLVLTHPLTFVTVRTLPLLIVLREFSVSGGSRWDPRLCIRLLLMTPAATFLLIMCVTGASVYAISVMLPERARILSTLVFICGTVVRSRAAGEYLAGKLLGISLKSRRIISLAATVALLLLILCPLISFLSILGAREKARGFAADWDRQDAQLKAAKQSGVTDVTVPQIGDFQSRIGKGPSDLHLRTDSGFWINQTIATYYGLRSSRASEDVTVSH